MSEVSASPVQRGSLRIASRISNAGKAFGRGIRSTLSATNDTIARTKDKIKSSQKAINNENKKQVELERKNKETNRRKLREGNIEAGAIVRPVKSLVSKVIEKPLKSFWNLLAAWAVANLPAIIKAVSIFIKRVRIVGAMVKRAVTAIGPFFKGLWKITKAFMQNLLEFDFNDSKGRIEAAQKDLDASMEEMRLSVDEIRNVWGREEEELDKILAKLEDGETSRQALAAVLPQGTGEIQGETGTTVEPQTPALNGLPAAGGSPMNASDAEAFKYVYDLAKKHGAKYPEVAAAQAMQETGYLRNPNSIYFASGKTNAFGQTVVPASEAGSFKRRGIVNTIFSAGRHWAVYDSFESGVKDHVNLWHKSRSGMRNYNDYDTAAEGVANILSKYSPDKDPENIRRGFTEDAYAGNVLGMIRSAGIDPTGSAGQELGGSYATASTPQLTVNMPSAPGASPAQPTTTATGDRISTAGQSQQPGGTQPQNAYQNFMGILNRIIGVAPEANRTAESGEVEAAAAVQPNNGARGASTTLGGIVPFSAWSRTLAEGGSGRVGKTDVYDPTGTINARGRPHWGIDIGTNYQKGFGFRIKVKGRVVDIENSSGGGHGVSIRSGNLTFRCLHLASRAFVRRGPYNGEVVGEIGNTGHSFGEHLHFEVYVNGAPVDPQPYLKYLEIGRIQKTSSQTRISSNPQEKANTTSTALASRRTNLGGQMSPGSKETVIINHKEIINVA